MMRRDMVVLPAPEGDDRTSMRPRRAIPDEGMDRSALFDILYLLAQTLDGRLKIKTQPGQLDIRGL